MAPLGIVSAYLELARLDPAYRELYRQRARALLAPIVSPATYDGLRGLEEQRTRQRRSLDEAVARHEWERVAHLAGSVRAIDARLKAAASELAIAREAYDGADVPIGPLSLAAARLTPGGGRRSRTARERARALLAEVSEGDREWAARTTARRAALAAVPDPGDTAAGAVLDERQLEAAARRAVERGAWDALERMARRVHPEAAAAVAGCQCGDTTPPAGVAADAISARSVAIAASLDLVPVTVPAAPALRAYTSCRCAAYPALGAGQSDAASTHHCACHDRCPEIGGALRENLDLLKHRLFVTSCGERYLPSFADERVLLECFPESPDGTQSRGPLLAALGLPGRGEVARWEIEQALADRGPDLLARMQLDPWDYRLVCVPFDVYQRVGPERGWGRQPWWTHFDGYQVWRGWHLRALVGGHAHYGGPDDLTALGLTSRHDNTVVRLAVVRRARLMEPIHTTEQGG